MTGDVMFPEIHRIVADSDLDGMCAAAVLLKAYPTAEVVFGHAAILRAGMLDDVIDSKTVTVDLPFHPASGWYLDHHLTNKPNEAEEEEFTQRGGVVHWEHTPSAARLAY
jgi:oligoribonuclease NrnB/cAMP/cGMP phosphodiesterase (DHH superfamily)